jgi:hypothetical protein
MVQIEYADGKRMNSSVHHGFLMFQDLVHLAPVEYLSQVIYNGQPLDGGQGMGYLGSELGDVSANQGKPGKNQCENDYIQHIQFADQCGIDFVKQKHNQRIIDDGKRREEKKLPDIQFEKSEHKNNQIDKQNHTPG